MLFASKATISQPEKTVTTNPNKTVSKKSSQLPATAISHQSELPTSRSETKSLNGVKAEKVIAMRDLLRKKNEQGGFS